MHIRGPWGEGVSEAEAVYVPMSDRDFPSVIWTSCQRFLYFAQGSFLPASVPRTQYQRNRWKYRLSGNMCTQGQPVARLIRVTTPTSGAFCFSMLILRVITSRRIGLLLSSSGKLLSLFWKFIKHSQNFYGQNKKSFLAKFCPYQIFTK